MESERLLAIIERRSLETSATVPQIADAFSTALAGAKSSGLEQDLDAILDTTIRVVQAAGAFDLGLDKLRQEINSLFTGNITEDSEIAKKLGFDSASVRKAIAAGNLYAEIIKRTEALAVAASAQSQTLSGVLTNVAEIIDSTVARALSGAFGSLREHIANVGEWVLDNRDAIVRAFEAITQKIGEFVGRVRAWAAEHGELLREVAAIGAVVGGAVVAYGLLAGAIALLTSPITLTIAAIVGLALAWERAREWGEVEIGGRPIAAYVRTAYAWFEGLASQLAMNALTTFRVIGSGAKGIFGGLVEVVIAPFRVVTGLLSQIPDSVAALVPGAAQVRAFAGAIKGMLDTTAASYSPMQNFADVGKAVSEQFAVSGELWSQTLDKMEAALRSKDGLPSIADAIFGGIVSNLRGKLAEINAAMAAATRQSGGIDVRTRPTTSGASAASGDARSADEVKRQFEEFMSMLREVRSMGDPVAEAVGRIERQRDAALRQLEAVKKFLDEFKRLAKPGEIVPTYEEALKLITDAFKKAGEEIAAGPSRRALEIIHQQRREFEAAAEEDRLALIADSTERELQLRLHANEQWLEAQQQQIEDQLGAEKELKKEALDQLAAEKKRRDDRDRAEADRRRDEETVGTAAWVDKLHRIITEKLGSIPEQITKAVEASLDAIGGAVDGLFETLLSGSADFGKTLQDFAGQLGSIWSRLMSNMLTKSITTGESIVTQFRQMTQQLNQLDGLSAVLAGAGIGQMVGGVGAAVTGNPNAALGGTIGGALGAAIGLLAGNPAMGAWIGSAIGTAIGSAIQQGQDSIRVAISNVLGQTMVTVVENGISAEGRDRVARDIRRRTNEIIGGYQDLIELFPEELRAQIRGYINPINFRGGVSGGDITDGNALEALGDFLSETMPQRVFSAYSGALRRGLSLLGVSQQRIEQEFERMGELEGRELQEAVRAYINGILDTRRQRDLFTAPFGSTVETARRQARATPLDRMIELQDQLGLIVSSLPRLDVGEQLTAIREVNRLSQQRYEMEIAYLQRIDAIQQSIRQSIAQQREQLQLGGMGNQERLDFFFERMYELRQQLAAATDPEEIQRLVQQIQGYVSQASGVAPDNAELRQRLLDILGDVEGVADERLAEARRAVEEQHRRTAEILERAAQALLDAAGGLRDAIPPIPINPNLPRTGGKPRPERPTIDPFPGEGEARIGGEKAPDPLSLVRSVQERIDSIARAAAPLAEVTIPQPLSENWTKFADGMALAATNVQRFNASFGGSSSGEASSDVKTMVTLLRDLNAKQDREIVISGNGRAFIEQMGFVIEQRVVNRLKNDRDLLSRYHDR